MSPPILIILRRATSGTQVMTPTQESGITDTPKTSAVASAICIAIAVIIGLVACTLRRHMHLAVEEEAQRGHALHRPVIPSSKRRDPEHLDQKELDAIPMVTYKEDRVEETRKDRPLLVKTVSSSRWLFSPYLTQQQAAPQRDVEDGKGAPESDRAPGLKSCSICTEDLVEGSQVRRLPCGHYFHDGCIEPWLMQCSTTCPMCRVDARTEPSRTSIKQPCKVVIKFHRRDRREG